MRNPAVLTLACQRGPAKSVSIEAEEKEDEEWEQGGHENASAIPVQEVQSTASCSSESSKIASVCPNEKSILKLHSILPQSFMN